MYVTVTRRRNGIRYFRSPCMVAKSADPDDMDLHSMIISHLKENMSKCVNKKYLYLVI